MLIYAFEENGIPNDEKFGHRILGRLKMHTVLMLVMVFTIF